MAIDKRILKMGGDLSGYAPDEIQVKNVSNVTSGTLPVANGGTGLSTTPTNGQLLIGSGSSYSLATLTAGDNITITNGSGTITIAATGGGGGGSGDITEVTAGTNLTGGGTSGAVTLNLADTISLSVVTASVGFSGGSFTGTTISGTIGQLTTLTASSVTGTDAKFNYVDYNNAAYSSGGSMPALVEGRLFYDQDALSLTEITDQGTLINLGKQLTLRVKNSTGATLSKGKIVRITGNNGNTPSVNTASWDNDSTSANTLAVVMADISDTQFGYVLLTGLLKGVNTNGMTSGQMLYLSSSGDYTNVTPSSQYHEVRIGQVIDPGNNGTMFVRIQNGYELNELHDVDAASPAYGDLLSWTSNGGNNQWRNTKQLTGSYGLTGSLSATGQISGSSFVGVGTSLTLLTASNIQNFTTDVIGQFTAGTGIAINSGQISASSVPNSSLQNSSITILGQTVSLGGTATVNAGGILSGTLPSPTHLSSSRYATDGVSNSYIIPLAYGGSTYTTIMAESGSSSSNATGSYLRVKAGDGAALTVSSDNPSVPNAGLLQLRGGIGGNISSSAQYLTASSGQGGDLNIYGGDAGLLQGSFLEDYFNLNTPTQVITGSYTNNASIFKVIPLTTSSYVVFFKSSTTVLYALYYTVSGATHTLAASTTLSIDDSNGDIDTNCLDYVDLVYQSGTTYRFAYGSTMNTTNLYISQVELSATGTPSWGAAGTPVLIYTGAARLLGIKSTTYNQRFVVIYRITSSFLVVCSVRNSTNNNSASQTSSDSLSTEQYLADCRVVFTNYAFASGNGYFFYNALNNLYCKPFYVSTGTITTGSSPVLVGTTNVNVITDMSIAKIDNSKLVICYGGHTSYSKFRPLTAISQSTTNHTIQTGSEFSTLSYGYHKAGTSLNNNANAFFAIGYTRLNYSYIVGISGSGTNASIVIVDADQEINTAFTQSYSEAAVLTSGSSGKVVFAGRRDTSATLISVGEQTYNFAETYSQKAGDINIIGGSAQKDLAISYLTSRSTGSSINLIAGDGQKGGSINLYAVSGATSGSINLVSSGSVNITGSSVYISTPANYATTLSDGTTVFNTITIEANPVNQSTSAAIRILGGSGSSSGGSISIYGGSGGTFGGDLTLTGGIGSTAPGDVIIAGGSATGVANSGSVYIGPSTFSSTNTYNSKTYMNSKLVFGVGTATLNAATNIDVTATIMYCNTTVASTVVTFTDPSPIDGQMLIIVNNGSAAALTLSESGAGSNLRLVGTTTIVLTATTYPSATFIYNAGIAKWIQIAQPATLVATV